MNESEAQYLNKLEQENARLKRQIENFHAPSIGECFKFPDNPYIYKLCQVGIEGQTFFVLYCITHKNLYGTPTPNLKQAFGNSFNYDNRIKVDDPRSQHQEPYSDIR